MNMLASVTKYSFYVIFMDRQCVASNIFFLLIWGDEKQKCCDQEKTMGEGMTSQRKKLL